MQGSGLYSSSGFYFARSFAETPFHLIFGVLSAVITYWMWGLQSDAVKFWNYLLIVVLVTNCGVSVMLFSGTVSLVSSLSRRATLRDGTLLFGVAGEQGRVPSKLGCHPVARDLHDFQWVRCMHVCGVRSITLFPRVLQVPDQLKLGARVLALVG